MALPSFLIRHELDTVFTQPQLTRYHHPYRAPINSERLNLEVGQMRYDFYMLYAQFTAIITILEANFSIIDNGSGVDIYSVSWSSMATPTPTNTLITSLQTISQSIERMSKRLSILEEGL